ncbi:Ubiquitin-conjugating enzyme E2 [Giardia duodenalis]|uniref:Ubiquitin-conjugating enzyme E2 n=1 Tax=Giardia intestinalis (strain ATCC 50803 / WB clone C6) TaxID=184922 RepID=A8B716_GIAIC|nr:Ubiquitin-conjugating enzyme E2 [Giardia intestinalis]KAE8301806.1 Ubiquitin-conjugating enzyme E2 [Giardia intestinalis]|eukprot:XP_001709114.1 Ubiquitin-conjugating enzyme E2-28.4 kDa [Giardia lamblia ATCC 50803]
MNVVYRRISHELKLISMAGETYFRVYLDPSNMLNVHFTFLGPSDSPFSKGLYHGIIHLPQDYPHKPPEIVFLTSSGRFETNRYICTSFTSFHPESWNPTWGIRNIIIGLRSLFDEETPGSIGSITASPEVREKYALDSHSFTCRVCGCSHADLVSVLHESPVSTQEPADHNSSQTPPTTDTVVPGDVAVEACTDMSVSNEPSQDQEQEQEQITEAHSQDVLDEKPEKLPTEPFSVDDPSHAPQMPSDYNTLSFSSLALAAISRGLLRATQSMSPEDHQPEETQGLDLLAHLVAGASIPSSVFKLVSHLRENAEAICAGVQPHSN